jgi:hypothetical protein
VIWKNPFFIKQNSSRKQTCIFLLNNKKIYYQFYFCKKSQSQWQQRNYIFWVDSNRNPVSLTENFLTTMKSLVLNKSTIFKAIKSNNICPHCFTKPNDFKVTNLQKIKQKSNKSKSVTSEKINDVFSSQIVFMDFN